MESKALVIDLGVKRYRLNDVAEVCFNPTDPAFADKLYTTFEGLDQKQEQYKADAARVANKREVFDFARKLNAEMRQMLDAALGDGVSAALFGDLNVYALSGGLPLWANLLLAIMDEMEVGFEAEAKLTHPRIQKYSAKYKK